LKDEYRYLLFAARKYLISDKRINAFVSHAQDNMKLLIQKRKEVWNRINTGEESTCISREQFNHALDILDSIDAQESSALYTDYKVGGLSWLSNETINKIIFANVTECSKYYFEQDDKTLNGILLHQLWLRGFFFVAVVKLETFEWSDALYESICGKDNGNRWLLYIEYEDAKENREYGNQRKECLIHGISQNTRLKFAIGRIWEKFCQDFCSRVYPNVVTNAGQKNTLPNGDIPDIAWGENLEIKNGQLLHATVIAECKKSLYFLKSGSALNNYTTYKYYEYCDELQYWILEKPDKIDCEITGHVKLIFADDLLMSGMLNDLEEAFLQQLIQLDARCTDGEFIHDTEDTILKKINESTSLVGAAINALYSNEQKLPKKKDIYVIRQFSKSGEFLREYTDSKIASAETGISHDAITRALRKERPTAGGYIWEKALLNSPVENVEPVKHRDSLVGKEVIQLDDIGTVIAIYKSVREASRKTGINEKSIRDTINGRQKKAGGFWWSIG
jgi:hypothetical protein